MNVSFYTAVSGMSAYQKDMDVISHNMANVSTIGYKSATSSFADLLYTQMDTNVDGEFLVGHGVKNQATDLKMRQGTLNQTGLETDFAIVGEGFFKIDRGGDDAEYTRNGAFTIGMDGKKAYLVTTDGGYVLDDKGKRIALEFKDGTNVPDLSDVHEKLGIYTFSNPQGLSRKESSSFTETNLSGKPKETREKCDLIQGSVEFSSVDISEEMVNVIQTQKAFQFNAKLVQTSDQIEEIVNNLR